MDKRLRGVEITSMESEDITTYPPIQTSDVAEENYNNSDDEMTSGEETE